MQHPCRKASWQYVSSLVAVCLKVRYLEKGEVTMLHPHAHRHSVWLSLCRHARQAARDGHDLDLKPA
jgi:hypothetical protein